MLKYSFFLLRHSIGNIRKPKIVEMLILPKLIYRHNLKSYWSSSKVFYTYIQAYLKIYIERHRASWTAKSILKNNNKVPSIKVYCISMVISLLKSRDITLPTKVHLVKAMVFPVVMYGCESWTIKKAECQRIDAFELWCWRRLLRVPWTSRRSNQSILKESWVFIGRTDVEAETPILWPPDAKSLLIWKDPDVGKDWRREEQGTTEDEMVGWCHRLNGHEFG